MTWIKDNEPGLPAQVPMPPSAFATTEYALVRTLQRRVADRLTAKRQQRSAAGQGELGAEDERQLALALIHEEIAAHVRAQVNAGQEPPAASVDEQLARAVESAIFGAGALQDLLDDPDVENIDINGCDEVFVTYAGQRGKVRAAPVAASDEDLVDIVRTLGQYAGPNARPFTPTSPELDLRLGDGSRLSAVMKASVRPSISIRRNRYTQMFLARVPPMAQAGTRRQGRARPQDDQGGARTLLQLGTVDEQLAAFLEAAVLARCNIVVAGATDAGKTTLLRALIHCIPPGERLVTVERALELDLRRHPQLHPDVTELEEVLPGPDGNGGMSIGQLVRRSRRMNPSRVIVGEVMGPEVLEMLSAMSQGNDGSLSTIHARDAAHVFSRLATFARQHAEMPFDATYALIGGAIDLVVFVRKNPRMGGQRTVMEVLEVTGDAEGHVTRSQIFIEGPDGRAVRDAEVPIMRAGLLAEHGYADARWEPVWGAAPSSAYGDGRGADPASGWDHTAPDPAPWAPIGTRSAWPERGR